MQQFPFEKIISWHKKNGRHTLPWRAYFHLSKKELGYHVWLSEIILQQTQAERCVGYYKKILGRFPTIESLSKATYEEFFPYYKWLGYYSRARNMLKAAQMVVEEFGGIFPEETEKLIKIPWIWPYTAQAIRAFAYDIPTLSFDTNLEKIFSRFYFGNRLQKLSQDEKNTLTFQFQKTTIHARTINAALMDFASLIDINSKEKILWSHYPLLQSKFYETRGALEPQKEKHKSSFPTKKALVIAILHENHKMYFSPFTVHSHWEKHMHHKQDGESPIREFSPFYIWRNTGNPRAQIQQYFLKIYWLEVSVRPPEVKSYKHETPYLVCYTQIQSGKYSFEIFKGIQVRGNEESFVEGMEEV